MKRVIRGSVNDDNLIINKTYIILSDCFYDTISSLRDADWDEVIDVFESNNWISGDDLIIPKGTKMTLSEVNNYYNVFEVHTPHGKSYIPFRIEDCDGLFREVTDREIYSSHKSKSPYEVNHGITYTRSYSNDSGDQISIFVYDDDPDKQEYGEGGPSGDYFRGRWTKNMQDYYTRKGFKLDNTLKQNVSSAKAIDNVERRSQGVNRSATNSEYAVFKKTYSHSREFKDMDKQSGDIRDLTDELDNKDISYDIYYNKTDNGCTIFYDDDGTVTAAYYGEADENYNSCSFMEGDQLEWSGLYGGQYKGVVTDVNDEYITVDVMWIAEDTGDTITDTQKFEITTDAKGKKCIIVWTYGSHAGYVYPPSCDNINSAESVDNSESEFQRYAKQRKQSSEFNKWLKRVESAILHNDTTRIKNIKESLMYMTSSQLSDKLTSYLIDKLNSALTTSSDDIKSASYGGAFDIEDDQFFTKDEIVEFGNTVCDHLNETFHDTYDVSDVYMETPKKLVLTVVQESDESEFTATIDIDMRKIKKPADLINRYLGDVVYALQQDIKAYNDEINASSDITSAQKTGVEWIKTKVWNAIVARLEDCGFELDDIKDYTFVDVEQTDDHIRVEVRGELSYEALEDLISVIDPVVQEWDPDAYFEPVEPGIAEAYIWNISDITSSTNAPEAQMIDDIEYFYEVYPEDIGPILIRNGADLDKGSWLDGCNISKAYKEAVAHFESKYDNDDEYSELDTGVGSRLGWSNYIKSGIYDVPDRPLDPPEDNSWEEIDTDDEVIEVTLDAIVHIDENGSWEYDDTNYPWAASPDSKRGDWYTDEYSVYIGDKISIVEYVDELLQPMMPAKEGEYHIKGDVTLVFSVKGIEVKRDYFWDDRHGLEYDEESYTDDAETSFLYDKSYIKNFEITER